ncbi:MAG: alkyl sulfatase dimerization domain-containing protein [Methyloligellaceae bacterium]
MLQIMTVVASLSWSWVRHGHAGFVLSAILLMAWPSSPTAAQDPSPYMGGPVEVKIGPKGEVANAQLIDHSARLQKKLYKITDGLYNLVGVGLANSTMIEGETGLIIIDTGNSVQQAEEHLAEFRKVSDKPVKAIIYTHNHYAFGARVYETKENKGKLQIWAHKDVPANIADQTGPLAATLLTRAIRQYGVYLPDEGPDAMPNQGIGPYLVDLSKGAPRLGYLEPNHLIGDHKETIIDGVRFEFRHAPSDANDSIHIWLPEKKVLINNIIWPSFYNLHPLRGSPYRDPQVVLSGIDWIRERAPEHLVGTHGPPLAGKEKIAAVVTEYRDAIQFVYDQTVRGMNKGLSPDELVEFVKLPPTLSKTFYTQELYGEVPFYVRQIYVGLLGWFGYDTAALHAVPRRVEGKRLIALAGGPEKVVAAIKQAMTDREFAWAAQLGSHLVNAEPDNQTYRQLKADALRQIGQVTPAANTRSWALTEALELEGKFAVSATTTNLVDSRIILQTPPGTFVNVARFFLDPAKSAKADVVFGITFTDLKRGFGLHVRSGVAEFLDHYPERPDFGLALERPIWADIRTKRLTLETAIASGKAKVSGSIEDLRNFFALFDVAPTASQPDRPQ